MTVTPGGGATVLPHRSPHRVTWGWLVAAAARHLDPSIDHWLKYPIDLNHPLDELVVLRGPAIYGVPAVANHGWLYVGQTWQQLNERFTGHRYDNNRARRSIKRNQFHSVCVLPLRPDTSRYVVDRLERQGQKLLRPIHGSRWPTTRGQ